MSRWITKQLSPVTLSLFGPFPRSILQPRPIRRISRQIRFSFSPSLSPRRQGNAGILPKSKAFLFRFFLPSPVVALSLTPIYILFSAQKYPLSGHPLFFSRLFVLFFSFSLPSSIASLSSNRFEKRTVRPSVSHCPNRSIR